MRTLALIAAGALALAPPSPARAAGNDLTETAEAAAPTGLALGASLGGGVEAGLKSGSAGLLELELVAGWEVPSSTAQTAFTLRPELAFALGLAPDVHVALRPGVRVSLPETPLWLRVAADWSNARGREPHWRWLLVGVAWEVRLTSALGLSLEADTGLPLSNATGMPLLLRAAATFRP